MNSKTILKSTGAILVSLGLVACGGGDRRGANTSARPHPFAGVWMAEGAYNDFTGPVNQFCFAVGRYPSRHGLRMDRYGIPGVRIMKITNDGDVFRWSPSLRPNDPRFSVRDYFLGRVGVDGSPIGNTFRSVVADGIGTFRLRDQRRMAQVAGPNPFRVMERNAQGQVAEVRDPAPDFTFVRVGEGEALNYLERLRQCQPAYFGGQEQDDYFPSDTEGAAPAATPPRAPARRARPSRTTPVAPAAPVAPKPETIAPTGGYIPDDGN